MTSYIDTNGVTQTATMPNWVQESINLGIRDPHVSLHITPNSTVNNYDFYGLNYNNANFSGVTFNNCDFNSTIINNSNCTNCVFILDAGTLGIDFTGTILHGATLTKNINVAVSLFSANITAEAIRGAKFPTGLDLDANLDFYGSVTLHPDTKNKVSFIYEETVNGETKITDVKRNIGATVYYDHDTRTLHSHKVSYRKRDGTLGEIIRGTSGFPANNLEPTGDFKNINLSGLDLSWIDLAGVDLTGANLSNTNLSYANLRGAILTDANFSGANFSGADLTSIKIHRTNLSGANFAYCSIDPTSQGAPFITESNLNSANFNNAKLTAVNFTGSDLKDVTIANAVLNGVNFTNIKHNFSGTIEMERIIYNSNSPPPLGTRYALDKLIADVSCVKYYINASLGNGTSNDITKIELVDSTESNALQFNNVGSQWWFFTAQPISFDYFILITFSDGSEHYIKDENDSTFAKESDGSITFDIVLSEIDSKPIIKYYRKNAQHPDVALLPVRTSPVLNEKGHNNSIAIKLTDTQNISSVSIENSQNSWGSTQLTLINGLYTLANVNTDEFIVVLNFQDGSVKKYIDTYNGDNFKKLETDSLLVQINPQEKSAFYYNGNKYYFVDKYNSYVSDEYQLEIANDIKNIIFNQLFGGLSIKYTNYNNTFHTYEFPLDAESWAGVAAQNTGIFPINFLKEGGFIEFQASVHSDRLHDTNVIQFKFEASNGNSYMTNEKVIYSRTYSFLMLGSEYPRYLIHIPQSSNNWTNLIMYIKHRGEVNIKNIKVRAHKSLPVKKEQDIVFSNVFGGLGINHNVIKSPSLTKTFDGFLKTDFNSNDVFFGNEKDVALTRPFGGAETSGLLTKDIWFSEAFGGAWVNYDSNLYGFNNGAETWAGFSIITSTPAYPFKFTHGGVVKISARVVVGESANIKFRFEKNVYPDTEPSLETSEITIAKGDNVVEYTVVVPNTTNEFNNIIMYINNQDVQVNVTEVTVCENSDPSINQVIHKIPSTAESWAGFSIDTQSPLYPFDFRHGGLIEFTANLIQNGNTNIKFRFEKNVYPDTDPSYVTDNINISSTTPTNFSVSIPKNVMEFNSIIMYIADKDVEVNLVNLKIKENLNKSTIKFPTVQSNSFGEVDLETDYPLNFPLGGSIEFDANIVDGNNPVEINFALLEGIGGEPNQYKTHSFSKIINDISSNHYTITVPENNVDLNSTNWSNLRINVPGGNTGVLIENIKVNENINDTRMVFPSSAEIWAGIEAEAEANPNLYPITIEKGGVITFKAQVINGGDAHLQFRLEADVYPNNEPSYTTNNIKISGSTLTSYSYTLPAIPNESYNNFIMYIVERDVNVKVEDVKLEQYNADPRLTFLSGSESWAGVKAVSESFPFSFPIGGYISFDATVPTGSPVDIKFTLVSEPDNPHSASYTTETINLTGTKKKYYVSIPDFDTQEINALEMYIIQRDIEVIVANVKVISYQTENFTSFVWKNLQFNHDIGNTGWGNQEYQTYNGKHSLSIADDTLKITAKRENGGEIVSARAWSVSDHLSIGKGEVLYINLKAKLPTANVSGVPLWPAIWLLGEKFFRQDSSKEEWPHCGEIDIMEHFPGIGTDTYGTAVHFHNGVGHEYLSENITKSGENLTNKLYDYGVEIIRHAVDKNQNKIKFLFNNSVVKEYSYDSKYNELFEPNSNPDDVKRFGLLLNLAVGGVYTGHTGNMSGVPDFTGEMEIKDITIRRFSIDKSYQDVKGIHKVLRRMYFYEGPPTILDANLGFALEPGTVISSDVDVSNLNLIRSNLSGIQFPPGADLTTVQLDLANMSGTDLSGVTLGFQRELQLDDNSTTPLNIPTGYKFVEYKGEKFLASTSLPTDIGLNSHDVYGVSQNDLVFDEKISPDSVVGYLYTQDQDGFRHDYSFVSGEGDNDNSSFRIDGNKVIIEHKPLYINKNTYNIRIKSVDVTGNALEKSFTLRVNRKLQYTELIKQLGAALTDSEPIKNGDIDGSEAGELSGHSVALSNDGTRVIIGAPSYGNGWKYGRVRVYDYDINNNTWSQVGSEIIGEHSYSEAGYRVAISGDGSRIGFSAIGYGNVYDNQSAGQVKVFDYDPLENKWKQVGQGIIGEVRHDDSGESFSMSNDGTTVAIGSIDNTVEYTGDNKGHVRIFKLIGTNWTQLGSDIDGQNANDKLGKSLSLSGNGTRVAIGVWNKAGSGPYSGSIKVLDWNGSGWVQTGEIYGEPYNQLGYNVSISDNGKRIAASSPGVDSARGRVQVFELNGGTWTQLGDKILGEAQGDYFGQSLSMSSDGDKLVIGADFNQGVNGAYSGHARMYKWNGSAWLPYGNDIDGEHYYDRSGFSVAISGDGNIIAVGAIENDGESGDVNDNRGHVRVYRKRDLPFTPPTGYNLGDIKPGMDLSGVNLSGVNLSGADLTGTNFTNAYLTGTNFTNAYLTGTNFTNTNLTGANFTNANLRSVNFTNANLQSVNFTNAIISLSDFKNATLTFTGDVTLSVNNNAGVYNPPFGYIITYNESGVIVFRRTSYAPTNITLSHALVPENIPAPTLVGTISTEDSDSNTFTYSFSGGPDDSKFNISGDKLYINVTPDFEAQPHYTIQVRTTDESGNSRDQLFTIQILDLYYTSVNTTSFSEYTKVGSVIATLSSSDIVDPASYSFVSGYGSDDNNSFTISNNQILLNTVPDRLTKSSYTTRIKTSTGSDLVFYSVFTFTIQKDVKLSSTSFEENILEGREVATISINDSDNANFVYSIVSGWEDHDSFSVEGNKLKIKNTPNYEVKPNYNIKVKAVRGDQSYERQFTLSVIDKLEHLGNEYIIQDQTLTESQKTDIKNIISSHNSGGEIPQTTGFQINSKIIGNISVITDLYVFSDTHSIEAIPNIPNLENIYLDKSITEIPPNTLSQINNSVKMNVENIETVSQNDLKKVTKVYSKNRTEVDDDVAEKMQTLKNGTKENIRNNFRDVFTQLKTKETYISKPKAEKRVVFKQALKNAMKVVKKSAERVFKIDKTELFEVIDIPERVKEKMEARGEDISIVEKSQDENDVALVFDENNLGNFYCDLEVVGDKVLIKFFGTKVKLERTSETENTVTLLSTDEGSEPTTLEGGNIVSESLNPTLNSGDWELPFFFGSVGGSAGAGDEQQSGDICFPAGTPVQTDQGEIAIEKLTSENTIDGVNVVAVVPVYNECDYLVKINKHALGPNYPKKTTLISRNHRVYINKKKEKTIPALALYNGKTITVVQREEHETIYNVLLPTYSKMTINGLVVETLHPKSVYARKM